MEAEINKGKDAQAAIPSEEISRLFEVIIGNIEVVLLVFAVMIVLVAGIGIMVSIYNSMNDRRHEIAIMRALGAQRSTVMMVILLESILLSLGGGLLGLGMGHGLLAIAGPWIAEKVNLPLSMLEFRARRIDLDSRADRAGLDRRIPARGGRLPHRRGQVVDCQPVRGYNGSGLGRISPVFAQHHRDPIIVAEANFQFADDRNPRQSPRTSPCPDRRAAWRPRIAAAIS